MDKIKVLAAAVFEARERFQMLGAWNVCGLTEDKKKGIFIDYEVARTELDRAKRALEAEQSI